MSFIDNITVLILTYDEASNISRTLDALIDFSDVVVLDSGSKDDTLDIVARYPNTRVVSRVFDSHEAQWNYGLTACGITRDWVLALDADYVLPHTLVSEISRLVPEKRIGGYRIGFNYCVFGRRLSGTLYPPIVALYRRQSVYYIQDGHTQRIVVDGDINWLRERIDHDDRKSLGRWLASQSKYAGLEVDLLLSTPWKELRLSQKLRRLVVISPWLVPLYCLIACKGILDGWPGLFYAFQRAVAEGILAIHLLETKVKPKE
jgi:glycosyltransferase involved in cell wall biosynthesis